MLALPLALAGCAQTGAPGGDVRVAGTAFNATSSVQCSSDGGASFGACPAGIVRRGGGSGTVEITLPGGAVRSILFLDGVPVSANSTARVTADRTGDTTLVRLGGEAYRIPDAFVFGG